MRIRRRQRPEQIARYTILEEDDANEMCYIATGLDGLDMFIHGQNLRSNGMFTNRLTLAGRLVLIGALLASGTASAEDQRASLDADPNLVGWWKLDETEGIRAADSSRHERGGTLEGDASFEENSVDGKAGKALKLDGKNDLLGIKGYKGVAGTRARTTMAWIKTGRPRGEIISWGKNEFGKKWVFGYVRGRIGVTPHGGYYYMNEPTHNNEWHHVAVVVAEAELPNLHDDVTLYLDGEIAEIHDIGLLDLWPIETGDELDVTIGRGFEGSLDDVRIYDRPLRAEEVKTIFQLKSNKPMEKP